MSSTDLTTEHTNANKIVVYGTPGNQFGDTMLGGDDVIAVNTMLEESFEAGIAGAGDPVVKIGEYKGRSIFEQKAADQIRISLDSDGNAYVKLIVRQLDPGLGLAALAGGFKDEGETDAQAADREELEEAKGATGQLIAKYSIDRHPVKGDVRVWGGPDRDDGVKNGDIIAMSTIGMVPVVKGAHGYVEAGDDATSAGWVALSGIQNSDVFGIKGHAKMLLEAAKIAGVNEQFPKDFEESLVERENDVTVGSPELQAKALALVSGTNDQMAPAYQVGDKPVLK